MKKFASLLMAALLLVTMALPASAVDFTPSVQQKPAPSVETVTDASGNQVSAIIQDASGNEVHGVTAQPDVHHPRVSAQPMPPPRSGSSWKPPMSKSRTPASVADLVPDVGRGLPCSPPWASSSSVEGFGGPGRVRRVRLRRSCGVPGPGGNTITIRFQLNIAPSSTLSGSPQLRGLQLGGH